MEKKQRKYITFNEAMEITGVSRRTIYNWITNYNIEVKRTPSGNPRINRLELLNSTNKRRDSQTLLDNLGK